MLSTEHPLSLPFLSISHISWPVRFVDFNHLAPSNSSFPSTLVLSFLPYLIHKEYNCSSHDSPAFLRCQHKERILSQTGSSYPAISHVFLFLKIQVSLALFLSFQGIPSVITEWVYLVFRQSESRLSHKQLLSSSFKYFPRVVTDVASNIRKWTLNSNQQLLASTPATSHAGHRDSHKA